MEEILSIREREKYSLAKALTSGTPGADKCFESEISDSIRRRDPSLSQLNGTLIPLEILNLRALQSTAATAGGYLSGAKEQKTSDFIFPPSLATRYGAVNVLSGSTSSAAGNISYPRVSASDEGVWLTPGTIPNSPTTNFGQLLHEPNRCCAYREVDLQLLNQSWEADAFVRRMIIQAVGAAIDRAALAGSGNAQPLGLVQNAQVATVAAGTNGSAPTLALLNSMEDKVFSASTNDENERIYAITPALRRNLKAALRGSSTNSTLLETIFAIEFNQGQRHQLERCDFRRLVAIRHNAVESARRIRGSDQRVYQRPLSLYHQRLY